MKEIPILYNEEMSLARSEGRKTETRRIIKPKIGDGRFLIVKQFGKIVDVQAINEHRGQVGTVKCPYGKVGEKIWIKEAYYAYGRWYSRGTYTKTGKKAWWFIDLTLDMGFNYKYNNALDMFKKTCISPKFRVEELHWEKRNRLFMPRRAARFVDEIVEIKIERVQNINWLDCKAEGISYICEEDEPQNFIDSFKQLWNSINKERGYGWNKNPWVWVIKTKY